MRLLTLILIALWGIGNVFAQEAGKRMDANALRDHIRGLAKDDPDVRCFNRDDFDACHEIWKISQYSNNKIRQQIHEVVMRNPQRAQLELLIGNGSYTMVPQFANESIAVLQKIYRTDAVREGNADDWLKSFRLRANDADMKSFIEGASVGGVSAMLSDPAFHKSEIRNWIHEAIMRNPQRAKLEALTSNSYYTMDSQFANESIAVLQKIYRRDALRTGDTNDFLKSFRLRANDEDMKSFIENAPLRNVFSILSDSVFKTTTRQHVFRDLAQQRFLAENSPNGYYYAYRNLGNVADLDKAVTMIKEIRSDVANEIVTALFERSFSTIDQVDKFANLVERCLGCSSNLYALVPKLRGFRRRFDVSEFLPSREYKYYFSRVSYSASQEIHRGGYKLEVASNDATVTINAKIDCKKGESYISNESLNFLEKIGALFDDRPGEYISGKAIEMQKYSCKLGHGEADELAKIAAKANNVCTIQRDWDYESEISTKYVWSPVPVTTSSAYGGRNSLPSYCSSSDTCFDVVSTDKSEVTIQCTKGNRQGQTKKICGPSGKGKWASGCGLTDTFAYHYTFKEAGNRACD